MRALIKAAIRIIIIIMFLRLVYSLIQYVSAIFTSLKYTSPIYILGMIAVGLIGILVLYLLWRKTDWLVRILAGNIKDNELVIKTSNLDLIKVAMGILGIYLLVTSVPDLFGLLVYHIHITKVAPDLLLMPTEQALEIKQWVTTTITILVGVWLVSRLRGIEGIVKLINNVWNKGQIIDNDDDEE